MIRKVVTLLFLIAGMSSVRAQDTLSITLENVKYPYPVSFMPIHIEGQDIRMAYMDIRPAASNGKTVMLFHGKLWGLLLV
jgi:hypothetical protein